MGKEQKTKGTHIRKKDFERGKYTSSIFKIPLKDRIKFLFTKGYLEVKTPAILNMAEYPVRIVFIKGKPKREKNNK